MSFAFIPTFNSGYCTKLNGNYFVYEIKTINLGGGIWTI